MINKVLIKYPINDSTLYCKKPRILFNLNNTKLTTIYIKLNNNNGVFNFISTKNPENFSAIAFKNNDNICFIPDYVCEGENIVSIRACIDGEFSNEQEIKFYYEKPTLAINNELEPITANNYKKLFIMTKETLKAYNRDIEELNNIILPVSNYNKIYMSYFSKLNDNLYNLNKWINDNYPGLNRIYNKKILSYAPISKEIYNSILQMIISI